MKKETTAVATEAANVTKKEWYGACIGPNQYEMRGLDEKDLKFVEDESKAGGYSVRVETFPLVIYTYIRPMVQILAMVKDENKPTAFLVWDDEATLVAGFVVEATGDDSSNSRWSVRLITSKDDIPADCNCITDKSTFMNEKGSNVEISDIMFEGACSEECGLRPTDRARMNYKPFLKKVMAMSVISFPGHVLKSAQSENPQITEAEVSYKTSSTGSDPWMIINVKDNGEYSVRFDDELIRLLKGEATEEAAE